MEYVITRPHKQSNRQLTVYLLRDLALYFENRLDNKAYFRVWAQLRKELEEELFNLKNGCRDDLRNK
jgi:hypothetical protein